VDSDPLTASGRLVYPADAMRILFFSHYFPPEGNAPAARTHENTTRWVRRGHQVTVVTCVPSHPAGVVYPGYRNRWRQREVIDGVEVVRVLTYVAPNQGTVRRTLNYLSYMASAAWCALFLPRPDVIVATSPQFFCGWAGVIASRLRGAPLVLEIRDLWPESIEAVEALRGRPLLRALGWLERRMYAAARRIVTVGDGYRERLLARGVPDGRISVVMNGIDLAMFRPRERDAELTRRLGLEGRFVVGYTGTIGMASGLEVVLRAAELLRRRGRDDVRFLLVGDGAVRGELEAEARRRGLDNVVFTGRQDRALVPSFLSACDACLVHLRRADLFETVMPSKLFEAAGMARPLILGVGGEARALMERAGCGIAMEPEDETQLVEAILRLAGDPGLRESLGRAGRAYVEAHHDRDRLASDYLAVLEKVVGEAPARPGAGRP
jgi:glycosyltransferase involved in cell wall biosynthesis